MPSDFFKICEQQKKKSYHTKKSDFMAKFCWFFVQPVHSRIRIDLNFRKLYRAVAKTENLKGGVWHFIFAFFMRSLIVNMSHCVKTTSVFAVVVAHSCICPQQNFFLSLLSASPRSQNGQKVLPFNRDAGRSDNMREEINGILLPKLFWPTARKNCSSNQEKLLKFQAEGQEFAKCLRSL